MLTHLEIRDYQSLAHLSLELGMLTVVTGPSSSGKSAAFRALGLLAFNARGTSYIRHGAKSCTVQLTADESVVKIKRGARGSDSYDAWPVQEPSWATTWTKLASKVPPDVAEMLRLSDLNFAGQFDRPYLLTDSAGEVARRLGELTNVTLLFGAAQLANTRRLRINGQLADARAELARLTADVQRFKHLNLRQHAVRSAAEGLETCTRVTEQAAALRRCLGQLETAQDLAAAPPPLPATAALDDLLARRDRVNQLHQTVVQATIHAVHARGKADAARRELDSLSRQLDDARAAAGICPTCGQEIPHYTEVR